MMVVRGQIPDPPTTIPWQIETAIDHREMSFSSMGSTVRFNSNAAYHPGARTLTFRSGHLGVDCLPLLEFDRSSPDHSWSLLAPRYTQPIRRYAGETEDDSGREFHYSDGSRVVVEMGDSQGSDLTAFTPLATESYSHLNSYCRLEVAGHQSLAVSFSPCQETTIDVLPADYPVGRPARFAYVDATYGFHVCEATSGEKGPFCTLASGRLDVASH
jgi:hypothetical protein